MGSVQFGGGGVLIIGVHNSYVFIFDVTFVSITLMFGVTELKFAKVYEKSDERLRNGQRKETTNLSGLQGRTAPVTTR